MEERGGGGWGLGDVIHFNRAVSGLLAAFSCCSSFQFHMRHYMHSEYGCQHNAVNNKRATVELQETENLEIALRRENIYSL